MVPPTKFADWAISIVRTSIVPAIVGLLGAAAIYANTSVPPEGAAVITTGLAFAYWAAVRGLESKFPKAGWLLLLPRPPSYTTGALKQYGRSALRTFTPYLVGLAVGIAAKHGFNIDSKMTTSLVSVIAGGGFYSSVRAVEPSYPNAGKLLGAVGAPTYDKPATDAPDVDGGGC